MARVNTRHGLDLPDYDALYAWSVTEIPTFWNEVWDFADIVHSAPPKTILGKATMPGAEWFVGARLNFAENLLRHRDESPAIVEFHESGQVRRLSHRELYLQVAKLAQTLRALGVTTGDRVAAFMPNRLESVVGMLATTSIGAIWSSCSPDFGFKGVMDRFGQISPKVLIACDGYTYGGKPFSSLERVRQVVADIASIERVLIVGVLGIDIAMEPKAQSWADAVDNDAQTLVFEQLPFDHPLYIMYSSGTTGVPKCIVHGAGGALLQHAKELILHCDLQRDDALFYFTTCGWMMWNWLVSGLYVGSTIVLFDGSPAHPDIGVLWRMAEQEGITHFGTSPKFLSTCKKAGVVPKDDYDLSRLRAVMSTGSPLSAELFDWVYSDIKTDVQLASICGGTDIISCFMLGSPISPVYSGEIQKRGLGMKVEAWSIDGRSVLGDKGELVCTAPFVSMPIYFWDDAGNASYHKAYFDVFDGVWRHGDYVEITTHGGVIVYGRSDATLNPGGVRIGTAEIYRQVESLDEIADAIVIGQRWQDDTRVVLFVVLAAGVVLDDDLIQRIKTHIRKTCTPRHVPEIIRAAPAIPRTISGKKVEIAVTRILHGETVNNRDALANPEALDFFKTVSLS